MIQSAKFPSTRYQGSKVKLADWIWDQISHLSFESCLDAFGGTGAVAYKLKEAGKQVTYNDLLKFNHLFGKALIENSKITLASDEVDWILSRHSGVIDYPTFVQDTFSGIYFTDDENTWIDQTITNINQLENPYKRAIAFFALAQSCIIKRPYNLFHRKNLYMRLADVKRSFGNQASWDKPFAYWFSVFVQEANQAIFDNGQVNRALNFAARDVHGHYDLVYIDTPYITQKGIGVDYLDFYHFLEGLTMYDVWASHIDYDSKHLRLKRQPNQWHDKRKITEAFDTLFRKFQDSILVVSYRSDGIPSKENLIRVLQRSKSKVHVLHFGEYKYALSKNSKSEEILLIGI